MQAQQSHENDGKQIWTIMRIEEISSSIEIAELKRLITDNL